MLLSLSKSNIGTSPSSHSKRLLLFSNGIIFIVFSVVIDSDDKRNHFTVSNLDIKRIVACGIVDSKSTQACKKKPFSQSENYYRYIFCFLSQSRATSLLNQPVTF